MAWRCFCFLVVSSFFIMDVVGISWPSLGHEESGAINKWFLAGSGLPVQLTADGAVFFPAAQLDAMAIASLVGCFLVWRQLDRILQVVTMPHFDKQVRRRLLQFGVLHLVYAVGDTLCEYFLWQTTAPEPSSSANGTHAQARRNPEQTNAMGSS